MLICIMETKNEGSPKVFSDPWLLIIGFIVNATLAGLLTIGLVLLVTHFLIRWWSPPWPHANELRCKVTFGKTGETYEWDRSYRTILNLMLNKGVKVNYDCERGDCAKCAKKLESGSIRWLIQPKRFPRQDILYTCITEPETDITIKA